MYELRRQLLWLTFTFFKGRVDERINVITIEYHSNYHLFSYSEGDAIYCPPITFSIFRAGINKAYHPCDKYILYCMLENPLPVNTFQFLAH